MNDQALILFVVPITAIVGLWAFLIVRSLSRSKVRELEIRERIALIEKGHVPPPEVDPRGFDRAMAFIHQRDSLSGRMAGGYRHRRAGIALIGVGLGLMVLISFAGDDTQQAIGVGGFLVMLGLAFVVNSLFERRSAQEPSSKIAGPPVSPESPRD
jgi:hypothetical protein